VTGRSRVLALLQRPIGTLDLLMYLQSAGIRSISAIIRDVRFSPPVAYSAIRRLLELGFIFERSQREVENRVVFGLTSKGERVAQALLPVEAEVEATLTGYLGQIEEAEDDAGNDSPLAIHLRISLSEVAFLRGDWKTAYKTAKQAARLAKGEGDSGTLGRAYLAMGRVLQKQDDPKAPEILELAFHAAMRAGELGIASDAQRLRGCLHERRGSYPQSQGYFEEASSLARKAGDKVLLAKARLGVARLMNDMGQAEKAARICEEAIEIFESGGDEGASELPGAYTSLGAMLFSQSQRKALRWHERAIKIAERLSDPRMHGYALTNAAAIYVNTKKFRKAEVALGQAIGIFEQVDEPRMLASAHLHLGVLEEAREHWAKSEMHFRMAAAGFERLGHPFNLAEAELHRGRSKARQGKTGPARELLEKALKSFRHLGASEKEEEARQALAGLS